MTVDEVHKLSRAYEAKFAEFGGLDEFMSPVVMYDPRFLSLLKKALDRGYPITDAEFSAQFPDAWEVCEASPVGGSTAAHS
jgi:hypothetical protein